MRRAVLLLLASTLAACGDSGSTVYQGSPPAEASAFGECAFCHQTQAQQVLPFAADLRCTTCHAQRLPGFVGRGHRALPAASLVPAFPASGHELGALRAMGSCAYCHAEKANSLNTGDLGLRCTDCHRERLSPEYGPHHQSLPAPSLVPNPPPDPHDLQDLSFWGKCALCHAEQATSLAQPFGGTAATACTTCHREVPGMPYGRGHASRPGAQRVPDPALEPHRPQAEASWGDCALCHNRAARSLEALLGPAGALSCATCHPLGSTSDFGPAHRLLPAADLVPDRQPDPHAPREGAAFGECALCHRSIASAVSPVHASLTCEVCHAATSPGYYGRGHRTFPPASLVPAFLGPAHELGKQGVFGSCAFCHSDKAEAMRNSGAAELGCLLCHEQELGPFGPQHRSLPDAGGVPSFVGVNHGDALLRPFGACAFCHRATTEHAVEFGHGNLEIECDLCHAAAEGTPYGPGHASITGCATCHGSERRTHQDPRAGSPSECAVCHDPHGSDNAFLLARFVRAPNGELVPLRFENVRGLADGSFASVSGPGSGLCEVCHSATRFFRNDGRGEPHFAFPCFTCHPHRLGFSVRP